MIYLCYLLLFSTLMQPVFIFPSSEKIRLFFILAGIVSIGALKKKKNSSAWEDIPLKNYVTIMFIAYVLSDAQHLYLRGTIDTTILWAKKILIFYCVFVYVDTPKRLKVAIWWVVIACSSLSYFALLYLLEDPTLSKFIDGRLQSVGYYDLSNSFALILTVTWPLAFILFELEKSKLKKLFLALNLCIYFYFCLLTKSRAGSIGICLAICLSFLFSKKFAKNKIIKTFFIIGIISIVTTVGFSIIMQRSHVSGVLGGDDSASDRIVAWKAGFRMLIDHPLFGIGWNRFNDELKIYAPGVRLANAHNTIISVFTELGLVGGITLILLIKYSLTHLYHIMKQNNDEINIMAQGIFISFVAFLFNTSFSVKDHDPSYWMILSLTAACIKIFSKNANEKTKV